MESQYSFGSFEASTQYGKEKPWPASAQPRKRSRKRRRKPHHTLRCLFPALSKPYPRSGIRDVFDRALAGDADELREGLRRLRSFAEQI